MEKILESIKILKKNKFQYDEDEYNYKLTQLYEKMSNCNKINTEKSNYLIKNNNVEMTEYKHEKLISDIFQTLNSNEMFKIKHFNKINQINELFNLLLIENNLIDKKETNKENYKIQTIPIIEENYDKNKIISDIKLYLHISDILFGPINKCIMTIIIYDTIFKNFKFLMDHEKFKITVKIKFEELTKEKDKFDIVAIKYNLDNNFFNEWIKIFEELE